jgi:putative ABC transport system permease protein
MSRVIGTFLPDLRYAVRACTRHSLISLVVIGVTALGVGGITALGAVVKRTLLDPLPLPRPHELVRIVATDPATRRPVMTSFAAYEEWRSRATVFSDIGAFQNGRPAMQSDEGAEPLDVAYVTESFDRVLSVQPALGRTFRTDEFAAGRDAVVMLTDDAWRRMFGGDAAAVGRQIRIEDRLHTIVGVLPPTSLEYPRSPFGLDAWLPMVTPAPERRLTTPAMIVARLQTGVGVRAAAESVAEATRQIAAARPDVSTGSATVVLLQDELAAAPAATLMMMTAALCLVLGIAAINLANLLLLRGADRRRDFAILSALGQDSRARARQLLLENLLLAITGAAAGLALAPLLMRGFLGASPDPLPRPVDAAALLEVAPFAAAAALATTVLASLPLLLSMRGTTVSDLRDDDRTTSGRGAARARGGLLAAQLALSLVLVGVGGQLSRTFLTLARVEPGYDDSLMAFAMGLVQRDRPERARQFFDDLTTALARHPGVTGVAMTNNLPTRAGALATGIRFSGTSTAPAGPPPFAHVVTPSLTGLLGLRTLEGRPLLESDQSASAPVALINDRLAAHVFGQQTAVGQSFQWDGRTWQIVGVVNSIRQRGPAHPVEPAIYVSWRQVTRLPIFVLVRSPQPPDVLATTIRSTVADVDRDRRAPIHTMATLAERSAELTRGDRFRALLTATIGGLGLALVVLGVYGNLSYAITRRRREIAIRIALGESAPQVRRRFVRGALRPVAGGLAVGALGSLAVAQWLSSLIAGFDPREPGSLVLSGAVILTVTLVASWIPASRASRTDPAQLLR